MGEYEFMDLLYSRYSSPLELMNLYINQGRFGELVEEIIQMNAKRKQEEAEKAEERKLWELYLHSMSDKSFNDWKAEAIQNSNDQKQPESLSMTNDQVESAIEKSRSMLKGFNPN